MLKSSLIKPFYNNITLEYMSVVVNTFLRANPDYLKRVNNIYKMSASYLTKDRHTENFSYDKLHSDYKEFMVTFLCILVNTHDNFFNNKSIKKNILGNFETGELIKVVNKNSNDLTILENVIQINTKGFVSFLENLDILKISKIAPDPISFALTVLVLTDKSTDNNNSVNRQDKSIGDMSNEQEGKDIAEQVNKLADSISQKQDSQKQQEGEGEKSEDEGKGKRDKDEEGEGEEKDKGNGRKASKESNPSLIENLKSLQELKKLLKSVDIVLAEEIANISKVIDTNEELKNEKDIVFEKDETGEHYDIQPVDDFELYPDNSENLVLPDFYSMYKHVNLENPVYVKGKYKERKQMLLILHDVSGSMGNFEARYTTAFLYKKLKNIQKNRGYVEIYPFGCELYSCQYKMNTETLTDKEIDDISNDVFSFNRSDGTDIDKAIKDTVKVCKEKLEEFVKKGQDVNNIEILIITDGNDSVKLSVDDLKVNLTNGEEQIIKINSVLIHNNSFKTNNLSKNIDYLTHGSQTRSRKKMNIDKINKVNMWMENTQLALLSRNSGGVYLEIEPNKNRIFS